MEVKSLDNRLSQFEGARDLLHRQITEAEDVQAKQLARAALLREAAELLRNLEGEWRAKVEGQITSLISRGLSLVFGEPIDVSLEAHTYRDTTALEIKVKQGDLVTSVADSKGGSLVQVLAFLWQVYVLRASKDLTPTLILDEPFAMVREEYRGALGELLKEIAKSGIQMLIIPQDREMLDVADAAYEVMWYNDGAQLNLIKAENEERPL